MKKNRKPALVNSLFKYENRSVKILKKTMLILQIALFSVITHAQDYQYQWAHSLLDSVLPNGVLVSGLTTPTNAVEEQASGVAVDNSGNVIIAGFMNGPYVDLAASPPIVYQAYNEIFIQKRDSEGKLVWSNYIDVGDHIAISPVRISKDIAIDSEDNIYICGYLINDTTDFDPGPGEALVDANSAGNVGFVAKYTKDGVFEFVYTIQGDVGGELNPRHITIDNNNNILVAGMFEKIVDFDAGPGVQKDTADNVGDNFLLKIDNSGNYIWHLAWGGKYTDNVTDIVFDEAGNSYALGLFHDTIDTDPGDQINILSSSESNSYISKFDADGNFLWSTFFKSDSSCLALQLAYKDGKLAVAGDYHDPIEVIWGGTSSFTIPEVTPYYSDNAFVIGIDTSGQYLWHYTPQASLPDDGSNLFKISASSNGWVVGMTASKFIDLDNGPGVESVVYDFYTVYAVGLSETGQYQWNRKLELDANGSMELKGLEAQGKDLYLTGYYDDAPLDVNPNPLDTVLLPKWFSKTTFLVKLSDNIAISMCGDYTIGNSSGMEDYPTLSAALADLKNATIDCDVTFYIEPGTYNDTINLNSLNNGDYTITFQGLDMETTIIHPLDGVTADKSGISIVNTNHIVFKNLTLEMDDISGLKVGYLGNGTKGISIDSASDILLDSLALSNSNYVAGENTTEYIASAVSLLDVQNVSITNSQFSGAGVLFFIDGVKDLSIESNILQDAHAHIYYDWVNGTYADSLAIRNNNFTGPVNTGNSAIYLFSNGLGHITNVVIENNQIDGMNGGDYGMYLNALDQPVIRNNSIQNITNGVFLEGNLDALLESNTITNISTLALNLKNGDGDNIVNNILSSDYRALDAYYLSNLRLVHNTFNAYGSGEGVSIFGATADSLVIVNNIFSVADTTQYELAMNFIKATNITMDYNLYSGNATTYTVVVTQIGGIGMPAYNAATLADWQTLQSDYDQNSQSFVPSFAGSSDYHITSSSDYRFGIWLNDVNTDIDGDTRSQAIGIDVGADQFAGAVTVPEITSFTPESGPIGTSVTLFGTGFSTLPTDNTVYFGATRAIVTSASSSELMVTVPPGATYKPITVAVNGLVAASDQPFNVTFDGNGDITENMFDTAMVFDAGPVTLNRSVLGDLDGNGFSDLVVNDRADSVISIFQNTSSVAGDITFAAKIDFSTAGKSSNVLLSDFDGDGKLDITVNYGNYRGISVFRNNSGSFLGLDARQDFTLPGTGPLYSIASGDLDGDGKMDLVEVDGNNHQVYILNNTSSGTGSVDFILSDSLNTGSNPTYVAIADIDQDQLPDIVTLNLTGSSISVFLNTGSGTFLAKQDFALTKTPYNLVIGDMDGDGKVDIGIPCRGGTGWVTLFMNNSTPGSLSLTRTDIADIEMDWMVFDDINGDGKTDIIGKRALKDSVFIVKNTSTPGSFNFEPKVTIGLNGVSANTLRSGDLNNDHEPDIIAAGFSFYSPGGKVAVLRNLSSANDFVSFSFAEQKAPATIDEVNHTIDIDLLDCTDPTALVATFELSPGATAAISGGMGASPVYSGVTIYDYTNPVYFLVTSEEGGNQIWSVTVHANSHADNVTVFEEACESYLFDSNLLTTSGTYGATFTNQNGCDSLVTLHLTIMQPDSIVQYASACGSFEFDGNILTTSGQYYANYTNHLGCDSVVILNLTVNPMDSVTVNVSACESYTFNGNLLTTSGLYVANYPDAMGGCDSVVTLNLTILEPSTGTDVISACESYTWIDGITYTESNNSAMYTLTNAVGCDSVVTLNLTILEPSTGTDIVSACESYTWIDGITYTESNNTATYTLTNSVGCDSVVTLNLTILEPSTGTDVISACESYTWIDGITYTQSNNTATYTLTNAVGCDSIVTLDLTIADTCNVNSVFGISNSDIRVYPNPVQDHLVIELPSADFSKIEIVDITGKIVLTQQIEGKEAAIDNLNFERGTYILRIVGKDQTVNSFLLIKN